MTFRSKSFLSVSFLAIAFCSPRFAFAGDKLTAVDQSVLSQLGVPPRPAKHQNFAGDSEAPGWRKKELETAAKSGTAQAEWAWGMFWIDEHWHQNPITMGVSHDEPDQKKAMEWLRKAQSAGFVQPLDVARVVQFFLVEGNRTEARFWLEQGALAGNTNCTRALIVTLSGEPVSPDRDRELARWNSQLKGDGNAWALRQQQLENAERQRQHDAYNYVGSGIAARNAAHDARVQAISGAVDTVSQAVITAVPQTAPDPIADAKNQSLANIAAAQARAQHAQATKPVQTASVASPGKPAPMLAATSKAPNSGTAPPPTCVDLGPGNCMPIAQYQQMMAQKNQQAAQTQVCPASGFVPGPGHYAACDAYVGERYFCTPGQRVPVSVPPSPPAGCGAVNASTGGTPKGSDEPTELACLQMSRDAQGMPVFHNVCSFALRYFYTPVNPHAGEFKEQNGILAPGETQTGVEGNGEQILSYACKEGDLVVGPDGSAITQAVSSFRCVKP